jgi:hypothetical protein
LKTWIFHVFKPPFIFKRALAYEITGSKHP